MTTGPELALAAALLFGGIIAAGPASAALARANWPTRAPRPALVLWQALCLGAGLSFIGAPLVLALHPVGPDLPHALWTFVVNTLEGRPFDGMAWGNVLAGFIAGTIALILTVALAVSFFRTMRRRRAHRQVIDLLAAAGDENALAGISVVDHPSALAYTLPGWHARVVLSAGLLDLLEPVELGAVIEHERAHLRVRDDLVQLPFQTWAAGLGPLPGVRQARAAVAELAEMLADDIALARCRRQDLASALAKVAIAGVEPVGVEPGVAGPPARAVSKIAGGESSPGQVLKRVNRLLEPAALGAPARAAVYLLALSLIGLPTAMLLFGWR
ncbi:M56 family peptidase [Nakamurella silvestris]|nr:M56 family peptidase [Nakamurella silvestris]